MPLKLISLNPTNLNAYALMTYPRYRLFLRSAADKTDPTILAIGAQNSSEEPIGLVLAKTTGNDIVQLLSLFTAKNHRKQGIAKILLQHLETELTDLQCKRIFTVYEREADYSEPVEKLLDFFHYEPYRVRSLIGRADREAIIKAPWLENEISLNGFELGLWKDVSDFEKQAIKDSQSKNAWYPEILTPFQEEHSIDPISSLVLRQNGQKDIVGWFINHRVMRDAIRFTAMFVRKEFQRSGLGLPMLAESIQRLLHHQDPHLKIGIFMIQNTNKMMMNFARKRLAPYLSELHESVERSKLL
ncbi:MAG: GNAT family N-acetyltransferase [Desulfobacteraceae bacterium]|nr:MAG: GNAT family N-acetyltransferase [Desulfobacteraceae bacterium]